MPLASTPYNAVGTIITPSYRHLLAFISNSLLIKTLFNAPQALYPHSFCVPHPFHILHQLPIATPGTLNNPPPETVLRLISILCIRSDMCNNG